MASVVAAVLCALSAQASASTAPLGADLAGVASAVSRAADSSLLVRFAPDLPSSAPGAVVAEMGGKLEGAVPGTTFHLVSSAGRPLDGLRKALLDDPRVAAVEPNHLGRMAAVPADPSYARTQAAYLDSIRLPEAWDVTTGAGDLVLAVVDSGVWSWHPDLAGRLLPGRDFVDGDDFPEDTLGHGTRVATIAAARANDAGMSGVAWRAKILPVKVVEDSGFVSTANLAAGIVWAADHGADVINLSIGRRPSSLAIHDAIRYAQDRDVLIVAAAGNQGTSEMAFPAYADGVLAVGAVDRAGHLAPFSNWGSWVDLVAPGTGILAGVPGGTYAAADGTSFAAPIVSGVALLARARFPHESAARIAERLVLGARDIGPLGRDLYYGHGLVDAFSAVGGPPPPRSVDPHHVLEPDNTPGKATTLRISEPVRAVLAPEGDADWFVLDLSTHGGLWFEVTATAPAAIHPLEPSLDVYDAGGIGIHLAGVTREPGRFRGSNSLPAGRYYLRVANLARSPSAPYELTVRAPAPGETVYVPGNPDSSPRRWVYDTTPVAGTFDAPTEVEPTIHFFRPVSVPWLDLDYSIVLTDTFTGRVVPTDRRVSHPNHTEWITLAPREPLVPGRVYEMSIRRGPQGLDLEHEAFRFAVAPLPPVPVHVSAARSGYWMITADGTVHGFGDAGHHGRSQTETAIVDLEPTPTGDGYWTVDSRGVVTPHGDAAFYGHADWTRLAPGEQVTSLSATPTGAGYWLFTDKGRVLTRGDAPGLGDMAHVALNGPVLDSIPTRTGKGYYMVAADGGIFTFGDAKFYGSMGGKRLNAPVQSLVPDPDGAGYWLVASDGGIFAFEANFRGSMGSTRLNRPVTGMVPFKNGYLMVAEDGGIFNFTDGPFLGSLGATPPAHAIVAVAALPN